MMQSRLFYLLITLFSLIPSLATAQKSIYIPNEWTNPPINYHGTADSLLYSETDTQNQYTWSKSRSKESDNVIVFWDKGYGSTAPNELDSSSDYYVDIDDLLEKCEAFYELETTLGFVDPKTSNISKYKVMVLINHTTDWVCYGGGYDYQVPALWLGPSACKPVGSAVAHEVGHSFHYMCYAEASNHGTDSSVQTGFHTGVDGGGSGIWETTAQWQALQSYPEEIFTEGELFANTHNYAFTHEWHRYQSYMFLFYLTEYYNNIKTVANVWNQPMTTVGDFNEVLMENKNLSVEELYKLHFLFALHCPTYDMEACKDYRDSYIGRFNFNYVTLSDGSYQVALASCPQATGFNVISLDVPEAGTVVTTDFTALVPGCALADGDPAEYINGNGVYATSSQTSYNSVDDVSDRAFRLGYVFLLDDGTTSYSYDDQLYGTGTGEKTEDVTVTVPENVSKMWLVVAPAPTSYYQHKWDESIEADDMWPYRVSFSNTGLAGVPTLDGRHLGDITFTYDVTFPLDASAHSGTSITLDNQVAQQLGTALQTTLSDLNSNLVTYSSSGPSEGEVMFYPVDENGNLVENASTANGYGHWFDASGNVCEYNSGNGYVFSEYYTTTSSFGLGQYPGHCVSGTTYTIRQAFLYNNGTEEAKAIFVFRITPGSDASATLVSVDYDEEAATGIYTIDESQAYTPKSKTGVTVKLNRTFKNNDTWNTFVVPFSISNSELKAAFGDDVQVANFTAFDDEKGGTFETMRSPSIEANVPVLMQTSSTESSFTFSSRTLESASATKTIDGISYVGVYEPMDAVYSADENRYVISANKVHSTSASQATKLKGTRAYIAAPIGTNVKLFIDNEATSIDGISANGESLQGNAVYTLSGQRVSHINAGGLYIVNGKKVLVK